MLTQMQVDPRQRLGDAAVGVGLLALLPVFLEWSIQVRTDQIAIAGGLWGAVALVASRQRPPLAVVAGLLFGLGYLGSQKLIYVASLGFLLAAVDVWRVRDFDPGRETLRLVNCLATLGTLVAAFFLYVSYEFPVAGQAAVRATGAGRPWRGSSSCSITLAMVSPRWHFFSFLGADGLRRKRTGPRPRPSCHDKGPGLRVRGSGCAG